MMKIQPKPEKNLYVSENNAQGLRKNSGQPQALSGTGSNILSKYKPFESVFSQKSLFSMFDTKENTDPVKDIDWKRKRLMMLTQRAKASGAFKRGAVSGLISKIMSLLASAESGKSSVTEAQINQLLQELSVKVGQEKVDKNTDKERQGGNTQQKSPFYESESKNIADKLRYSSSEELIVNAVKPGLMDILG